MTQLPKLYILQYPSHSLLSATKAVDAEGQPTLSSMWESVLWSYLLESLRICGRTVEVSTRSCQVMSAREFMVCPRCSMFSFITALSGVCGKC